jgi:hypothetical protein
MSAYGNYLEALELKEKSEKALEHSRRNLVDFLLNSLHGDYEYLLRANGCLSGHEKFDTTECSTTKIEIVENEALATCYVTEAFESNNPSHRFSKDTVDLAGLRFANKESKWQLLEVDEQHNLLFVRRLE